MCNKCLTNLQFFVRELRIVKLAVKAVLFEQGRVRALFYDIAVLHDQNKVRRPYRGKSVRHDKRRPALHHIGERLLNLHLRARVYAGRGFVEYEHGRTGEHYARYAEQLPLTLRKRIFVYKRVVAVFELPDKRIAAGEFCRSNYLIFRGAGLAVGYVFAYRAAEKPGILQYHAVIAAQGMARHFAYVASVHLDTAAVHVVKAH